MAKEPEVVQHEVKKVVGKRVPPGDRWSPVDNETIILDSLTDLLEYVFQKKGVTQFFMDAREGEVIEPEPTKTWSLYGED